MRKNWIFFLLLLCAAAAHATVFGGIRGLVHDAQHRPIAGAQVVIHAVNSDWRKSATTNDLGEFRLDAVPAGAYEIDVSAPGFADSRQTLTVTSGNVPKSGYAFAASRGGAVSTTVASASGAHGYVNTDPELDAIFIASGSGIRPGVTLDRVRNVDVAPTIAALLGLRMPADIQGRVIRDILSESGSR